MDSDFSNPSKTSKGNRIRYWCEESGVNCSVQLIFSKANRPREKTFDSRYRGVREVEGSRNRNLSLIAYELKCCAIAGGGRCDSIFVILVFAM